MLAIFSGTYATVVVLVPIIFIGGYVQTVLRPLSLSLTIALDRLLHRLGHDHPDSCPRPS